MGTSDYHREVYQRTYVLWNRYSSGLSCSKLEWANLGLAEVLVVIYFAVKGGFSANIKV